MRSPRETSNSTSMRSSPRIASQAAPMPSNRSPLRKDSQGAPCRRSEDVRSRGRRSEVARSLGRGSTPRGGDARSPATPNTPSGQSPGSTTNPRGSKGSPRRSSGKEPSKAAAARPRSPPQGPSRHPMRTRAGAAPSHSGPIESLHFWDQRPRQGQGSSQWHFSWRCSISKASTASTTQR